MLNEKPPFDKLLPTVENMGEVLYKDLSLMLKADGYTLSRLEIGESPQRILEFTDESFADERQKRLDAAALRLSEEEFAENTAQGAVTR